MTEPKPRRWYRGLTPAEWMALLVASAGWIFDTYAGQIYNITRDSMLSDLLGLRPGDPGVKFWGDVFLGVFLVGGAFGGILFGSLADRFGRRPMMIVTILMYTVFSGLTFFAQNAWEVALLRFLVALGTAGEWAVAATFVAEIFPIRSRAQAGAVFHATSGLGTWLAALVGVAVGLNWRLAYLMGVVPALLVVWIRVAVKEPPKWQRAEARISGGKPGSVRELLFTAPWGKRAVFGMLLATVGLGTFWCLSAAGQDLVEAFLLRRGVPRAVALARAQFDYGCIITSGGVVGMVAFGSFARWLGRRRAFAFAMLGGAFIVPATAYFPRNYAELLLMLPFYGALSFGFHAGFALYFPELFPTHLRATGTGFCFNAARLMAAVLLVLSGWIKSLPGMDLREAMSLLAILYLFGLVFLMFLPETKGREPGDG